MGRICCGSPRPRGLPSLSQSMDEQRMEAQTEYVGYRHWNRIRNSGDAITPLILERISGLPARSAPPDRPHILGVGSIMFLANKNSHIWGSGILNPSMPAPDVLESSFHAVRGKKTRDKLLDLGV